MSTVTKPQQTNTQLVQKEERVMEYIPFGSDEAIKLSVSIIQNMVCIPTKSGAICTERDAMKFMMLCKARALNPFEGDAFLQGYDAKDGAVFSLITAHQAFLKRAEPHPEFAGMRSGIVVNDPIVCPACKGAGERPNGKPCKACDEIGVTDELIGDIIPANAKLLGGWAIVYFKNRPEPMHKRVALSVFRKPFGRWNDDPAGMIVKCAEADALRSSFPTKLGGLYLREEEPVIDVAPATKVGLFGKTPSEMPMISAPPEPPRDSNPPSQQNTESAKTTEPSKESADKPAEKTAANPLLNDRTRMADLMLKSGYSWSQLQPVVAKELGNWAESIGEVSELSMQQCKVICNAWGDLEALLKS